MFQICIILLRVSLSFFFFFLLSSCYSLHRLLSPNWLTGHFLFCSESLVSFLPAKPIHQVSIPVMHHGGESCTALRLRSTHWSLYCLILFNGPHNVAWGLTTLYVCWRGQKRKTYNMPYTVKRHDRVQVVASQGHTISATPGIFRSGRPGDMECLYIIADCLCSLDLLLGTCTLYHVTTYNVRYTEYNASPFHLYCVWLDGSDPVMRRRITNTKKTGPRPALYPIIYAT